MSNLEWKKRKKKWVVLVPCTSIALSGTVELLLWDNFIQGIPRFRVHKIWSQKMFIYSLYLLPLLKRHLYSGERHRHSFWVPKAGFNLHSGDTLALKKWLTTKSVYKFKSPLVTMTTTFATWTISLKSMYCTCGILTAQNFAEIW